MGEVIETGSAHTKWHERKVISGMERSCLGHHMHIALRTVKSDGHLVEALPYKIFYRWDMVRKAIESVLNHHAFADTGALGSKLKPLMESFA
jgi:hypothetical protein